MLQFRRIEFSCFPFSVKRERYLALVSEWLETKLANVYSLSSQQRLRDPLVPLHLTDRTEREVSTCPVTPTLPLHFAIYCIVRTKINNRTVRFHVCCSFLTIYRLLIFSRLPETAPSDRRVAEAALSSTILRLPWTSTNKLGRIR